MTNRGAYRFTVKEDAEGRHWIALEPSGGGLPDLGLLGLELKDKTRDNAHAVANYLNDHIGAVLHTPT